MFLLCHHLLYRGQRHAIHSLKEIIIKLQNVVVACSRFPAINAPFLVYDNFQGKYLLLRTQN